VVPYPTLMQADAPQRSPSLREACAGLRWCGRAGADWRRLPHEPPPWRTAYQQARRWLAAGVFEDRAHGPRRVSRLAAGRAPGPTAAAPDGHTLRARPERGRATTGRNGARARGSTRRWAPRGTGGAGRDRRDGRGGLRGSGLHRGAGRRGRRRARYPPRSRAAPRGEARLRAAAAALGGRALLRLADPLPPPRAGLRAVGGDATRSAVRRLRPPLPRPPRRGADRKCRPGSKLDFGLSCQFRRRSSAHPPSDRPARGGL